MFQSSNNKTGRCLLFYNGQLTKGGTIYIYIITLLLLPSNPFPCLLSYLSPGVNNALFHALLQLCLLQGSRSQGQKAQLAHSLTLRLRQQRYKMGNSNSVEGTGGGGRAKGQVGDSSVDTYYTVCTQSRLPHVSYAYHILRMEDLRQKEGFRREKEGGGGQWSQLLCRRWAIAALLLHPRCCKPIRALLCVSLRDATAAVHSEDVQMV